MKLGIIGAMEQEVKTLQAAMEHPTVTTKAGMTFMRGASGARPRWWCKAAWARSTPPCASSACATSFP